MFHVPMLLNKFLLGDGPATILQDGGFVYVHKKIIDTFCLYDVHVCVGKQK